MKQILTAISLAFGLLVTGWAQSGFVVAGNNGFSVGQIFAIPAVSADGVSSSPGVQQAYVVTVDYADVRHEGEPYSGYGFYVPADAPDVDTVLTHYDPAVRTYYGYDSITNLALNIILIDCSVFAPATDGSGNQYEVVELMAHYEAADLMATTNWLTPGNDSSGFTMQPGGFYNPASYEPYQRLLVSAYIWGFTPGSYDIVATNSSGCRANVTMQVNVPGSTVADRTVKPCDVGSHAAQTGSAYEGNGFGGENYGLETTNGSGAITSVTDYDGNAYPVVQIGSQCWLAENLRVSHSPKTGSNLVVTAVNSYGSKMAAWYSNNQSTYEAKRYGLLYNWCAAMDTANPGSGAGGSGAYVEVADGSNNNNSFNFNPSGNHQGVCPIGWHVPTYAEWNATESQVSGSDWQASYETASSSSRGSHAGKLSTGCDWSSSSTENAAGNYANAERNESGFSAVPAGIFTSSFRYAGDSAYFWSSSQGSSNHAWYRDLYYNTAGVGRNSTPKYGGISVRCVRD